MKIKPNPFLPFLGNNAACAVLSTVALLSSYSAQAANTWDGGGGDTNWGTVNNWDNNLLPTYGTLTFSGSTRLTNVNNLFTNVGVVTVGSGTLNMSQLNFNSATAFTISGNQIDLFDNGGVQAKIENNGTGSATINLATRFAATAGATFGEINAVNGNVTFGSTGALTVNGSQLTDIRLYGSSKSVTFNNTVSASGRDFGIATSGTGNTVNIGGSFTADNFSVMNNGILALNSGGNLNSTAIRLGADYVGSGNINNGQGATFNLTVAAGGQSVAGVLNTGTGNTSGALQINSQNTSGTNTISGNINLDSDLKINQSSGGTLSITNATLDLRAQTLTLLGGTGTGAIGITGVIGNSTGSGQIVIGTDGIASTGGTVTLSNTNTYSGETFVRSGTLAFTSTGSSANSIIRFGSTSGTTVNANLNLTTLTGGATISSVINSVATSGSGTKTISSLNTSNTNTLSGHLALDSDLTISQATGGTLAITQARTGGAGTTTGTDIKTRTLTLSGAGTINFTGDVYNGTGSGVGNILMTGSGTNTLGGAQDNVSVAATVNSGTLILGKASTSSIHAIGSGLTVSGGTATLGGTGGDQIFDSTFVTVNSGTFGVNTLNETIGALSLVGGSITGSTGILSGSSYDVQAGTISAILGGVGALTKSTAGTVILSGANAYTGATTISAGTLSVGAANNLGAGSANLVFDGGTLQITGTALTTVLGIGHTVITNSGKTVGLDINASGNTFTFDQVLNQGTGGLTKLGTGTLVLNPANTYSGTTNINAGTISVDGVGNTGANGNLGKNGTINIGDTTTGATLVYTGTGETSNKIINLAGTTGGATITQSGSGNLLFTSNLTATGLGNKTLTLAGSTAGTSEISGIIADSVGFATSVTRGGTSVGGTTGISTLSGANTYSGLTTVSNTGGGGQSGTLIMSGTNSSAGATTVGGGILILNNASNGGLASGTLTLSNGSLQATTASPVILSNAMTLATGSGGFSLLGAQSITLNGDVTFTGQPSKGIVNSMTGGAILTFNGAFFNLSNSTTNIYLSSGAGATVINSVIQTGAVGTAGSITHSSGTLTLAGANTYAGGTTLSSGTLRINNAGSSSSNSAIGTGLFTITAGTIDNTSGGAITLATNNAQTWNGNFTFTGSNDLNLGTGDVSLGTPVGTARQVTTTAGNLTVGGIISNGTTAFGLTKAGTGQLTLAGVNTYTGVTTLTAGTLSVSTIGNGGVAGNLGQATSAAANLVFNGGTLAYTGTTATSDRAFTINTGKTATINITNNLTLVGATGTATSGALTKTGAGTLSLTGANTYTGATTVSQGKLLVNGSTAGGSAVSVSAGSVTGVPAATLGGTGTVGGNVSLSAESSSGFKNGGVLAPTAGVSGTKLSVTGTTTFAGGSIFQWDLKVAAADLGIGATNTGEYGQLGGTGAITGSNAAFKIVLGLNDFDDAFWTTDKSWNNVFSGSGVTTNLASIFSSFAGDRINSLGEVSGIGFFTFNGATTLKWTAVPEPSSALIGGLLVLATFRRRRA